MKKLLSILLTLVIAVCLVNLKSSFAKADTEGIVLGYHMNTGYGVYTDASCTTKYNGTYKDNITCANSSEPIFKFSGLNTSPTEALISVNVDATIIIDGENKIVNSTEGYGLIYIQDGNKVVMKSKGGANDKLIVESNGISEGLVKIGGQLTLESGKYEFIATGNMSHGAFQVTNNGLLIIGNANLVCKHNGSNGQNFCEIKNINGLKFNGNGSLIATNNENNAGSAIVYLVTEDAEGALDGVDIIASENTDGSSSENGVLKYETDLPALMGQNATRFCVGSKTGNLAKYIKLSKKQTPTPSPSEPVVKDESCEKVIGPTWHWNESKGICEEYSTVGTSTR